jgi:hypothetical protein
LLAAALERIVGDAAFREALAGNARRRSEEYVPDAVVPRIEAAYERATSAHAYPWSRRSATRA